jgi:hypothetical protein
MPWKTMENIPKEKILIGMQIRAKTNWKEVSRICHRYNYTAEMVKHYGGKEGTVKRVDIVVSGYDNYYNFANIVPSFDSKKRYFDEEVYGFYKWEPAMFEYWVENEYIRLKDMT